MLEGQGYTEVNGERIEWEAGDLLLLPIVPGGVEHKHFNRNPGENAKWIAFIYRPYGDETGSYLEQKENAPGVPRLIGSARDAAEAPGGAPPAHTTTPGGLDYADRGCHRATGRVACAAGICLDELFRIRDQQREQRQRRDLARQGQKLPWKMNPHGKMRWYLHPTIDDSASSTRLLTCRRSRRAAAAAASARAGQIFYVMEGRGYTLLDGVRHPWEAGDVISLPISGEGVTFQHFNVGEDERVLLSLRAEPRRRARRGQGQRLRAS